MSSCERPRNSSASVALPSSVSKAYSWSMRTHGNSCRRRASPSPRRVCSFSAASSSRRAANHSSRVPVFTRATPFRRRISVTDRTRSVSPSATKRTAADALAEFGRAVLELAVVLRLVVVSQRRSDEAVVAERPLLEAFDPNPLSGSAGSCVRAGERPVVLDRLVLEDEVVHEHLNVRKRIHERARDFRDLRGLAAVDRDRAARCVVAGDFGGIMVGPRHGVGAREVAYVAVIE